MGRFKDLLYVCVSTQTWHYDNIYTYKGNNKNEPYKIKQRTKLSTTINKLWLILQVYSTAVILLQTHTDSIYYYDTNYNLILKLIHF